MAMQGGWNRLAGFGDMLNGLEKVVSQHHDKKMAVQAMQEIQALRQQVGQGGQAPDENAFIQGILPLLAHAEPQYQAAAMRELQGLKLKKELQTPTYNTEAEMAVAASGGDPKAQGALDTLNRSRFGLAQQKEGLKRNWKVAVNPQSKKSEYFDQDTMAFTGVEAPATGSMGTSGFADDPQEKKDAWYENYQLTGGLPPFAYRDAQSRNAFIDGYPDYLKRKGITPTEGVVSKMEMQAQKGSLALQQKTYGMMGSFINNLNKQVNRVKELHRDIIKRVGTRGLDVPIRELNTRFVGSGQERVLESYLMEISREIGKLSTGAQASISELSVEAQAKWDKIHDPNLSFKELLPILEATSEQANLRRQSAEQELEKTKSDMKNIGKGPSAPTQAKPSLDDIFKNE